MSPLRRTFAAAALSLTIFGASLVAQHGPVQAATHLQAPSALSALALQHTTLSAHAAVTVGGCAVTAADIAAEHAILSLLNEHRAAARVRPLVRSATLSRASRAHSCDMATHGRLSHDGSDGSPFADRLTATGLPFSSAGENIGCSSDEQNGIAAIDAAMMAEPLVPGDHHWNIVDAGSTRVGIGVVEAGGQVWFTEDFIG